METTRKRIFKKQSRDGGIGSGLFSGRRPFLQADANDVGFNIRTEGLVFPDHGTFLGNLAGLEALKRHARLFVVGTEVIEDLAVTNAHLQLPT